VNSERYFYRFEVAYDGSNYHGWLDNYEVQTVQGVIKESAQILADQVVRVEGSSRTDKGVHALQHMIRIEIDKDLDPEYFLNSLQGITPYDIEIISCERTTKDWHPRFHAVAKRYLYRIWNGPRRSLFGSDTSWWIRSQLDVDSMNEVAQCFVGKHDFASFRTRSKDEPEDSVRTIHEFRVQRNGDHVLIQVVGNGFLYRMVRNLTGTLVEVGRGMKEASEVPKILAAQDRTAAGMAAPPEGLFLAEVSYDPDNIPRCRDEDSLFKH
jgi:tRNA pseudouridine38-40 synthase